MNETTTRPATFTIEFSLDNGKTWSHGMTRPAHMRGEVKDFSTVVRYQQRRHGHGVKTRVIDNP